MAVVLTENPLFGHFETILAFFFYTLISRALDWEHVDRGVAVLDFLIDSRFFRVEYFVDHVPFFLGGASLTLNDDS
jgi:hypothetical protein